MNTPERRHTLRTECQVIVHVAFKGHEKVFEAKTRNISLTGMYVDAAPEVLELLHAGTSLLALVEYAPNLLVRLKGYVVRVDTFVSLSGGFAVKFLDLSENQTAILKSL